MSRADRRSIFTILFLLGLFWIGPAPAQAEAWPGFEPEGNGTTFPSEADGRTQEQPIIEARRLSAKIELDGKLDEADWRLAHTGRGFRQMEPNRNTDPSVQTTFKILYDEDAIYFGVACYEDDISLIGSALGRRDQIDNSDVVSIYLDPYHDRTTGYNFRVNPDGVLMDQYVYDDGNTDRDWNAVWDAAVHQDEHGWYAEFRIPFSALRYRPAEEMQWGLQIYRWMHERGEDTGWASWDRDKSGFVSRFGVLQGLRDIPAPRQLEITPYFVARAGDPAATGDADGLDHFENVGADLKYGLTGDLTLNATFQPDFGQVEADPAVQNLSPFETFFSEKRPFFIEGANSFQMPFFDLFYSRRIGLGNENSRIRAAAKLLGKTQKGTSIATMVAATDVTGDGQAHNFLKSGDRSVFYGVARVGQEFNDGDYRINLMQTAVLRDAGARINADDDPRRSRDAFTTGMDFDLRLKDREWRLQGSLVGTAVDPAPQQDDSSVDHSPIYGTGGALYFGRESGQWRGNVWGLWEHPRLSLNDMGRLSAADSKVMGTWIQRRYDSESDDTWYRNARINLNGWREWLYGGREDGALSYGASHPQGFGGNINANLELQSRWNSWAGVAFQADGFSKHRTRFFDGRRGPLIGVPSSAGFWYGLGTDWRQRWQISGDANSNFDRDGGRNLDFGTNLRWAPGSQLQFSLRLGYSNWLNKAQWLDNFSTPGQGIEDVSYVFGELDNQVVDLTFRSSMIFTRDQSLELYLQPFLSWLDFSDARRLDGAATYEFEEFDAAAGAPSEFEVNEFDASFASLNLNLVYRWEYRPGSSFFLVWSHSRARFDRRGTMAEFEEGVRPGALFTNEPGNNLQAKFSYWFSL